MFLAMFLVFAQVETRYTPPTYFLPVVTGLLGAGAVAWLVAAVLGFARARAFGPSTRWFSFAAVFMIIYHLQFLLIALGIILSNPSITLTAGAFFNFFAVVAAVCMIIGFIRLTSTR